LKLLIKELNPEILGFFLSERKKRRKDNNTRGLSAVFSHYNF
jgi:competence protein ComGF